jgi:filamentous hemagglutinin
MSAKQKYFHERLTRSALTRAVLSVVLSTFTLQPIGSFAASVIVADPNAGKHQTATIMRTGNGLPLINIATPNSQGLSHNKYSKFNIDQSGAVLNNSRTGAATQMAGNVAGNPNLAKGSAKTILNEVGSKSQLKGFIEVAGQKAAVIIASPQGIACDGCGFINANHVTLTTGSPLIQNGQVTGYSVVGGQIQITGNGLNASKADYTDILTRALTVNAGIWANRLNVETGANQIDATSGNTANTVAPDATEAKPQVSIDISQLGGMYANQIRLVGTEAGVGVKNSGTVYAQAGNVELTADGELQNAGTMRASGDVSIDANKGISNSGKIYSENNATLATSGDVHNSNLIAAKGNLAIHANSIANETDGVFFAGLNAQNTLDADAGTQTGSVALDAKGMLTNAGAIEAANNADLEVTGSIQSSGSIHSQNDATLRTNASIDNSGSIYSENAATFSAGESIQNSGSVYAQSGATFTAPGELQNTGAIQASGDVSIDANKSISNSGKIYSEGDATLATSGDAQNSNLIAAKGNLAIHANSITNDANGALFAGLNTQNTLDADAGTQTGSVALDAKGKLTNAGAIEAANSADLKATGSIQNSGSIYAQSDATLSTPEGFQNTGAIQASGDVSIDANKGISNSGKIYSEGDATLATSGDAQNSNLIAAKGNLAIHANSIANDANGALFAGLNGDNNLDDDAGTQTGSVALDAKGTLTNAGAVEAANSADLKAKGSIQSSGSIYSQNDATLATDASIENSGSIYSQKDTALSAGESIQNSGSVYAKGDAKLSATGDIQNTNLIAALNDVRLDAQNIANSENATFAAGFNEDGSFADSGNLTVAAKGNIESHGQQIAGGDLSFTAQNENLSQSQTQARNATLSANAIDLSNTQIQSQTFDAKATAGDMNLTGATLIVHEGKGSLALSATGNVVADNARIQGNTVQIDAASLSNKKGEIDHLDNGDSAMSIHVAGLLDNTGGVIASNGKDFSITAQTLVNQSGELLHEGTGSFDISAPSFEGNSGTVFSNGFLKIQSSSIDFSASQIQGASFDIAADSLNLENAKLIQSDENASGHLQTQTGFDDAGASLLAMGDLAIELDHDFTNKGLIQSNGDLTITGKAIDNQSKLYSGAALKIQNAAFNNEAAGEVIGSDTKLVSDSLTNRGLIDGGNTRLDVKGDLLNTGTGRIYGDHLSIAANHLINSDENGAAATIAARNRLDIGAAIIDNKEHSLIYSGGDMSIGGSLDENGFATGQAQSLHNASATIESQGDMTIATQILQNTNEHFATADVAVGTPTKETLIQPSGKEEMIPKDMLKKSNWANTYEYGYKTGKKASIDALGKSAIPPLDLQCDDDGQNCHWEGADVYTPDSLAWAYFGITPPATAAEDAPNEPIAPDPSGADACGTGAQADKAACDAYNAAMAQYQTDEDAYNAAWEAYQTAMQPYNDLEEKIDDYNEDFGGHFKKWHQYELTDTETKTEVQSTDPAKIVAGGNLTLSGGDFTNDKSQIIAGGVLGGDIQNLKSIGVKGHDIVYRTGTKQYTYTAKHHFHRVRKWKDKEPYLDQIDTPFDLVVATPVEHAASSSLGNAPSMTPNSIVKVAQPGAGSDAQAASPTASPSVSPSDAPSTSPSVSVSFANHFNPKIPNSSFYTVNADPSATYLVASDPQFTGTKDWMSSDYLLEQVRADPNAMQKRVGDGFYEQQLIREQVELLTGRRYLDGFSNDEEEYKALMDNAASFAQKYHLTPGIALTSEQMQLLTSDIVWLVEEDVTLPDGTTAKALVPQLYAMVRDGDLDGSGTLISANAIDLRLSGTASNSGEIAGQKLVKISANDIENIDGSMRGDIVSLDAKEDLKNIGGSISANTSLGIQAGRDVIIRSDTTSFDKKIASSEFSRESIARIASLTSGGEMYVTADRNVEMDAAKVSNTGDGETFIAAKGDVTLGTVNTSSRQDIVASKKDFLKKDESKDVGTTIQTKGDVTIQAGHDVTAKAAYVESDNGGIGVAAGNDITLTTGQEVHDYAERNHMTSSGVVSHTKIDTAMVDDSTTALGTTFSGKTVALDAGHDALIHGSTVVGEGDVSIHGDNNVTIDDAVNTSYVHSETKKTKSGLLSGVGLGFTIGKTSLKQDLTVKGAVQSEARSTVGSSAGNVTITAGKDATVTGSNLSAGQLDKYGNVVSKGDILIQGENVSITPSMDTTTAKQDITQKSSGFTFAIKDTPIDNVRNFAINVNKKNHFVGYVQAGGESGVGALDQVSPMASFGHSSSKYHSTDTRVDSTGSVLSASGNVTLTATGHKDAASGETTGGDVRVLGSTIAAKGDFTANANHDIDIEDQTNQETLDSSQKQNSFRLTASNMSPADSIRDTAGSANVARKDYGDQEVPLSVSKSHSSSHRETQTDTPSSISGNNITLNARTGDIMVKGSSLNALQDVDINAKQGKANVVSSDEASLLDQKDNQIRVGDLGSNGTGNTIGNSFSIGLQKSSASTKQKGDDQNDVRSSIIAQNGSIKITSKKELTVSGADLTAGKDVDLTGSIVSVQPSANVASETDKSKSSRYGQTTAVSGAAVTALQTLNDAYNEIDKNHSAGGRNDARADAVYGAQAALAAYNLVNSVENGSIGKITSTTGFSKSSSKSKSDSKIVKGSTITAGGDVHIKSTEGDLSIQGGSISGQNVDFDAAQTLEITSAQNTAHQNSRSHSIDFEQGAGLGFGEQDGLTFEVGMQTAHSKLKSSSVQNEQAVITAGNTASFKSGGDTNINGAQIHGDTVNGDVGGNLNVASPQDTVKYRNVSASGGFGASICVIYLCYGVPVEVNANASGSDMKDDYASVTDPSGIFAGQGGFSITVHGNTDLKGAQLASEAGEDQNTLTTGTLTYSDLENHSIWSSDSAGMSASVSFGTAGGSDDASSKAGTKGDNGNASSKTGTASSSDVGGNDPKSGTKLPVGVSSIPSINGQSENTTGTTYAAVSPAKIIITDPEHQTQDLSQLNRDPSTANHSVSNDFSPDDIHYRQQLQQAATSVLSSLTNVMSSEFLKNAMKEEDAKAAADPSYKDSQEYKDAEKKAQSEYGVGSPFWTLAQGISGALASALGGNSAGAIAASALGPEGSRLIGQLTGGNKLANIFAHVAEGYLLGRATSGNGVAGAIGEGGSAAAIAYLSQKLYGTDDPTKLTEDQKKTLTAFDTLIMGAVTAGLSAATGGNTPANIAAGAQGGQSATNEATNNYLHLDEERKLASLKEQLKSDSCDAQCKAATQAGIKALNDLDQKRDTDYENCKGDASAKCQGVRQDVRNAMAEILRADDTPFTLDFEQNEWKVENDANEAVGGVGFAELKGTGKALLGTLTALGSAGKTAFDALTGSDPQALNKITKGLSQLKTFFEDPANWPALIGGLTPAQRNELADAYQAGDAQKIGDILGESKATTLLLLGTAGVGTIAKIGDIAKTADVGTAVITDTANAGSKAGDLASAGSDAGKVAGTGANAGEKLAGGISWSDKTSSIDEATGCRQVTPNATSPEIDEGRWNDLTYDPAKGKVDVYEGQAALDTEATFGGRLGRVKPVQGQPNADYVILDGPNKGKTVDFMWTDSEKADGINSHFAHNNKGQPSNVALQNNHETFIDHLNKADIVPVDYRVLNETNQAIVNGWIKELPDNLKAKVLIIRK